MLDDLDAASITAMPNTLRLIAQAGVTFDRAYATTTLCNPSRATFFTGMYPHSINMRNGGHERFHQTGLDRESLGPWLQRAGYFTAFFGKYVNDYPAGASLDFVPPGWNRWAAAIYDDFYKQYNYSMNEDGKQVRYNQASTDYFTDVLARKSVAFIDEAHKANRPLALIVAPSAPHIPTVAAPRHRTLFATAKAPRPASFQEANTRDKPPFNRFGMMSQTKISNIDKEYGGRLRMLAAADELIVGIVDALRKRDILEQTFIMVTSDHGYHMGQHNMTPQKKTAYEEDTRIPLLVRGPGIPRGTRLRHVVVNNDLAPTLVDLGKGKVPPGLDGRSFAPLLGQTPPDPVKWRRSLLIERLPLGEMPPPPPAKPPTTEYDCITGATTAAIIPEYAAVRTPTYTYVEYVTGDRELYDNAKDPNQLTNIYCKASTTLQSTLAGLVSRLKTCTGDTCNSAENEVVK